MLPEAPLVLVLVPLLLVQNNRRTARNLKSWDTFINILLNLIWLFRTFYDSIKNRSEEGGGRVSEIVGEPHNRNAILKLHHRVQRLFLGQNRVTQNNEQPPNFFLLLCRKSIGIGSYYVMWCLLVFERFGSSRKKIFINPNRKSKVLQHCFFTNKLSGARDN